MRLLLFLPALPASALLAPLVLLVTPLRVAAQAPDTAALKRSFTLWRPVPRPLLRDFSPGRPGISQSAYTVDAGHFQLETDLLRLHREDDDETSARDVRGFDLTAKIGLTRTLDLHFNATPVVRTRTEPARGHDGPTERHRGFGDVVLRLKNNLIGNDSPGPWALAVSGYAQLPTGGAVGDGAVEYGAALPASVQVSRSVSLTAQLEVEARWNRTVAHRETHVNHTFQIDSRFGHARRLEAYAEAAGFWNTGQHIYQATLNVGPAFYATPALRFDAGSHIPLTHTPLTREFFAGFSFRI